MHPPANYPIIIWLTNISSNAIIIIFHREGISYIILAKCLSLLLCIVFLDYEILQELNSYEAVCV